MGKMSEIDKLAIRNLLEERNALRGIIPRMRTAMSRGSDWLVGEFAPTGPIMRERDLSYCHKSAWGLYEAGKLDAVGRLLDWISDNAEMGVARYGFPEEPPFNNEMQLLYRFLTFGKVAEKLGHPSFANPEARKEVLTYQHSSGGVWGNLDKAEYMQVLNPMVTSFFIQWAMAANLMAPAIRSADFLAMLVERNAPHMGADPGHFYFNYDPASDDLVTEPDRDGEINCFVDTIKPKQQFYHIGTAMAALADTHSATGRPRYLHAAQRLAEFEQRLNPEGLRWPSYCKIGWGAAELYSISGLPEHRQAAANVSEVTFMGAQTDQGGWEDMYYPLKDHGVWESAVYDGSGRGAKQLPDDGTWAHLAGHEITGEFLAEMGCTLHVFEQALARMENRISTWLGHP